MARATPTGITSVRRTAKRRRLVEDDTFVRATLHAEQDKQLLALVRRMCA